MAQSLSRLPYQDNLKMAAIIRAGLPARNLDDLAEMLGVSINTLAEFVQIAPRTLARRRRANAKLKPDETERALRVARLLRRGAEVLNSKEAAADWFNSQLGVLGGKSPLEMCSTEPGSKEVENVLGRIEHGVFS